jgi:hypothetical protein
MPPSLTQLAPLTSVVQPKKPELRTQQALHLPTRPHTVMFTPLLTATTTLLPTNDMRTVTLAASIYVYGIADYYDMRDLQRNSPWNSFAGV